MSTCLCVYCAAVSFACAKPSHYSTRTTDSFLTVPLRTENGIPRLSRQSFLSSKSFAVRVHTLPCVCAFNFFWSTSIHLQCRECMFQSACAKLEVCSPTDTCACRLPSNISRQQPGDDTLLEPLYAKHCEVRSLFPFGYTSHPIRHYPGLLPSLFILYNGGLRPLRSNFLSLDGTHELEPY